MRSTSVASTKSWASAGAGVIGMMPALATTMSSRPESASPALKRITELGPFAHIGLLGEDPAAVSFDQAFCLGEILGCRQGYRFESMSWQISTAMMSAPSSAMRTACARP